MTRRAAKPSSSQPPEKSEPRVSKREPPSPEQRERERAVAAYGGRTGQERYARHRPEVILERANLCTAIGRALGRSKALPLDQTRILDVGCGRGDWLVEFEAMGAERSRLSGIDIFEPSIREAQRKLGMPGSGGAELLVATGLPWPWADGTFDVTTQFTVFTSILDESVRAETAREMLRVTRPQGLILWYDFLIDNPSNADVRGVRASEIRKLFPDCEIHLQKMTLAPPLHRRLKRLPMWIRAALGAARFLDTHYFGVIRPRRR